MYIENLDLETRNKIYNHTKKVLRKYQKGIINGKLTADKFAENILSNGTIESVLDKSILLTESFKSSYINYIQALINIQNQSFVNNKQIKNSQKITISQKVNLKKLLDNNNFSLSIPIDYLNYEDVEGIIKYIQTNEIELGNERIYNYITRIN